MFELTDSVLKQYRALRRKPEARREFSLIPFGAFVSEDEHPGGECALPEHLDDRSRESILQLVAARTALWLSGRVPSHLEQLWEEAKTSLPDWPGFVRLSVSREDKEMIHFMNAEMDAFEEALFADADEFSRTEDAAGIARVKATWDLTKLKDQSSEDDV